MSVTTLVYHPCHACSLRPHVYVTHHLAKMMERMCLTCSGSRGRSGTYIRSARLCRSKHTPESPTGNLGTLCVTKNESSPGGTLSHATGQIFELSDSFQILLTLERTRLLSPLSLFSSSAVGYDG